MSGRAAGGWAHWACRSGLRPASSLLGGATPLKQQKCHKGFRLPIRPAGARLDNLRIPERYRLPIMPQMPTNYAEFQVKPPRGTRELYRMMGEERVHNQLVLKQFGIVALGGGRLKHENFEFMRHNLTRRLHPERSFAIYRVPPPSQPITDHGKGKKMGGGKGSISHYVTPIKAGRIILEVAGDLYWEEVQTWLSSIATRLPFEAMAVTTDMMERLDAEEKRLEETNENPHSFEWLVRNNIMDCHRHLSPRDQMWFGKFVYRDRTLNRKWQTVLQIRDRGR